jgi:type IX secretion system PorP/SprF family membrane protein
MLDATFVQRSQNMGFKGAPSVWAVGVSAPFLLFDLNHGAVVSVSEDRIGNFDNVSFNFGYAYRHKLPNGAKVSAGFSLGGLSYKLSSPSEWSEYSSDPAIPQREESASTGFDIGLGAHYEVDAYYVSFACKHLNSPKVLTVNSGDKTYTVKPMFYLHGGYRWQTSHEDLEVDPTAMLSFYTLAKPSFELGANVFYRKRYWGGLMYRITDALGAMFGVSIGEGLKIGAAYEYPLSKMFGASGGNLEIYVSYAFELNLNKRKKQYKSIRFL